MTDVWAPPPRWGPYAPPRPPAHRPTVLVTVAFALVLFAGLVSLLGKGVAAQARAERARDLAAQRQEEAADAAADRALDRPADTATVAPGRGGTRRFESAPAEPDAHRYRLALPAGWEGRYVGVRENDYSFFDSILTRPGSATAVVIDRIAPGMDIRSREFSDLLYRRLTTGDPAVEITSAYTARTIGDGEPAYMYEGVLPDGGRRLRVVVFEHAGETFRVDFFADTREWRPLAAELDRILASWRWG